MKKIFYGLVLLNLTVNMSTLAMEGKNQQTTIGKSDLTESFKKYYQLWDLIKLQQEIVQTLESGTPNNLTLVHNLPRGILNEAATKACNNLTSLIHQLSPIFDGCVLKYKQKSAESGVLSEQTESSIEHLKQNSESDDAGKQNQQESILNQLKQEEKTDDLNGTEDKTAIQQLADKEQ
jgi:hypothetical protein